MNNYFCNSKRPHTVIKNLISDLRRVNESTYNPSLGMMKTLVKRIDYFQLNEIDYAILRFFILAKLSNNNSSFNVDNATFYNLSYNVVEWVNGILILKNEDSKKSQILNFLNKMSYVKDEAIRLQNMEKKRNSDLLLILNYCEI